MNNYHKFYGTMFTVTTAIISDNRELQGYAVFTPEVFRCLTNQIHGHICVMLEFQFYGMVNYVVFMFC